MKEMMNFEKFTKEVAEKIKTYLPDKYAEAEIDVKKFTKNNGLELTGLIVKLKDNPVTPNIYLEGFYEMYEDGQELEEVLQKISNTRLSTEAVPDSFDLNKITDFEQAKEILLPKLVNYEENFELLKDRPYSLIEDLAIIYYLNLGSNESGNMTVPVTYNLMYGWKTDIPTIHALACINLENSGKTEFKSMYETMIEMLGEDLPIIEDDETMFILGFKDKINGAAAILDSRLMRNIENKIGNDFYILPSSIHELLVIPFSDKIDPIALAEMVKEVNDTQVAKEDRLSYNVYKYNRLRYGCLEIV